MPSSASDEADPGRPRGTGSRALAASSMCVPATALSAVHVLTPSLQLSLRLVHRWQNWCIEKLRNLFNIIQVVSTGGGPQTHVCLTLESIYYTGSGCSQASFCRKHILDTLYLYCLGVSHALRAQKWYFLHLGLNTYWREHEKKAKEWHFKFWNNFYLNNCNS